MSSFQPMLAQAKNAAMADEVQSRLLMFGVYAVLVLLIAAWAIFIRKQKKKRRRVHRPHRWQDPPEEHKHRHHHRDRSESAKPPINPTLAETSGLPPVRPDDVPPRGT